MFDLKPKLGFNFTTIAGGSFESTGLRSEKEKLPSIAVVGVDKEVSIRLVSIGA